MKKTVFVFLFLLICISPTTYGWPPEALCRQSALTGYCEVSPSGVFYFGWWDSYPSGSLLFFSENSWYTNYACLVYPDRVIVKVDFHDPQLNRYIEYTEVSCLYA